MFTVVNNSDCAIKSAANNTGAFSSEEMERMARRRFQRGHLSLRGTRSKVWVAQWREDEVGLDGKVRRVRKKEVLGTLAEYKTKKLAQRELDKRLQEVNSLTYKPRPSATFEEFARRWERDVLSQLKGSTISGDKSRIRKHLLPALGHLRMRDLNTQVIQHLIIASKLATLSPKSVRNLIATLRMMWATATAWEYAVSDPFKGLVLPAIGLQEERFFTLDEMQTILRTAPEPLRTYYWILAETGIRCGEACGLPVRNLFLDIPAIKITQKVWGGKIETVKSVKGNRLCEISPQLGEHLRVFLRTWRPNKLGLLFATRNGTPWDADTVRKRKLYPLLEKLGILRCGFHAFRHGNESLMGQDNVPMLIRQNRMGHSDARTTMRYSHVVSEDGRRFAEKLGGMLTVQ
jgi:integrase